MKVIDFYIAKTVLLAIGLVSLLLSALQCFILFVNQLESLGHGDFGLEAAIIFVLLQLPYHVYLFFPVASLLGALIGLGILSNNNELIILRASGMSIGDIAGSVFKIAFILLSIVTIIGETGIPKLLQYSETQKKQALSGGQTLHTEKGIWLRYKNNLITIGSIQLNNVLENVLQYQFDELHNLKFARNIKKIVYHNGVWDAYDIEQTNFYSVRTEISKFEHMIWDISTKPQLLYLNHHEPDEMTLRDLHNFLAEQKRNRQSIISYQLAYWQRLLQPLATVVMMLLAIPFIFGPMRSSTIGARFLIGAACGFGFHIFNRLLGAASQIFQISAILAASAPIILFAVLGIYMMQRVR